MMRMVTDAHYRVPWFVSGPQHQTSGCTTRHAWLLEVGFHGTLAGVNGD